MNGMKFQVRSWPTTSVVLMWFSGFLAGLFVGHTWW